MTRVRWDEPKKRFYESALDRGVVYPQGASPIPWNGLISVKEAPTDSESSPLYQDGIKYRNGQTPGSFAATIDALTYPEEFDSIRSNFGFSYRTGMGREQNASFGYKLHLVYNALAVPLPVNYVTINVNLQSTILSWALSTKPAYFRQQRFSAHLVVDSTRVYKNVMSDFEDILYGTNSTEGRLPTPQEVLDFFDEYALITITDNGDGTWTAEGPDSLIQMIDTDIFEIDSLGAVYIDTETYSIQTW